MRNTHGLEQRVIIEQLRQRFTFVQRDWETVSARAAAAARDLGEPA